MNSNVLDTPKPRSHEILRSAMALTGYTHEKMSRAIGMSLSSFNLKINGHREFSLAECKRIAIKLGRTLDDLFFAQNVPK